MSKMYELSAEFEKLAEMLAEAETPEEFEAVESCMFSIKCDAAESVHEFCKMIADEKGNAEKIAAEIARLQARKKRHDEHVERLRNVIKALMSKFDMKKVQGDLFSVTLAKGSESVEVYDLALIPDEYIEVKTILQPDKAEIKKAIKAGGEVSGAKIIAGEPSVRIK